MELENKIKKLESEKKTLLENLDEKTKLLKEYQRCFDAAEHGLYYENPSEGRGRDEIYTIKVSKPERCGWSIILEVKTKNIIQAKLIQSALKQVFKQYGVDVTHKEDIYNDDDNTHVYV